MESAGKTRKPLTSTTLSLTLHVLVLAGLYATARLPVRMAPMRLPGTETGTALLPVYSLGGQTGALAQVHPPAPQRVTATPSLPVPRPTPVPPVATDAATSPGTGVSGDAAMGDGNINLALLRNHPSPEPDLSVLPHGAAGDVILDVVIDADGRISSIHLDHSLNPAIDETVMLTVQRWNFAPATRNGQPIASEQELLFHYTRS